MTYARIITFIVIVGLLSVTAIGFASMTHGPGGCGDISAGMDTNCPESIVRMVSHHIGAYVSFSSATVSYAASVLSLLALIISFWYVGKHLYIGREHELALGFAWNSDAGHSSHGQSIKLHRWLSLFENSPSA